MTKDEAIKVRDEYLNSDSHYIYGAWITNKQGTDDWFVDVEWYYAHSNGGESDFEKIGF